jgi:hypothetical protein
VRGCREAREKRQTIERRPLSEDSGRRVFNELVGSMKINSLLVLPRVLLAWDSILVCQAKAKGSSKGCITEGRKGGGAGGR